MKKLATLFILLITLTSATIYKSSNEETQKIKYLIQLNPYEGEGAYIVISLMNPQGEYEKTLFVQGDDPEWYFDIESWWSFYGKKRRKLDGITGATIKGGQRAVNMIEVDKELMNKGYSIQFESIVEDMPYYIKDVLVPLTDEGLATKHEGTGYIKYVRLSVQ